MSNALDVRPEYIDSRELERREQLWHDVERQMTPERAQEYQVIQMRAQHLIQEMHLLLETPSSAGTEGLVLLASRLNEEWERAQLVLANVYEDRIAAALEADSFNEATNKVLRDIETLQGQSSTQEERAILERLREIDIRLLAKPEDALNPKTSTDSFYKRATGHGMLIIDAQKANKAEAFLHDVINSAGARGLNPGLVNHAHAIQKALHEMRATNMHQLQQNEWYEAHFGKNHRMDLRPLRYILALIGAPITALGLYNIVTGKGMSLATPFWALVTAFSLKPDLLKGSAHKSVESLGQFNSPDLRTLLFKGFRGEKGARAFQELQKVYASDNEQQTELLQAMRTRDFVIEDTHITSLVGKNSSLYEVLQTWSSADRKKAIIIFGKERNEHNRALWTEYIRGA